MPHEEHITTQKYNQLASDNVDISRAPVQIGYVNLQCIKFSILKHLRDLHVKTYNLEGNLLIGMTLI